MRDALSKSLVIIAANNSKAILLTGDHGYALFDSFRKSYPQQYVNAGIAEQNMVGVAAGLARTGYRPIVYGLSAFVPIRVLEQIKLDVCHDNLPVIFLGDGAGFVYGTLGTSHQSTEDIAATRALPNLTIFSPCDRFEMLAVMKAATELEGPVYIRIGKCDLGDVHPQEVEYKSGNLIELTQTDSDITFFATGSMVKSAQKLAQEFNNANVVSVPTLKPVNTQQVVSLLKRSRVAVVFEEHSVNAGLGAVICEISAESCPIHVLRIGVTDRFSEHCGDYGYLLHEHGLDLVSIRGKINMYFNSIMK
jgi:transketolase